jgi:uncharacterized membrane protein YhhN
VPRLTARANARALAGLYAALGIASSASAAKRSRAGEWATKPLLMPVLAAFALVAAGDRKKDMLLPATGMVLSGLGDVALLGSEGWFVPGMGAFAAAHACYITALAREDAARGVRPRVAAGYTVLRAILISVLWRGLGNLRVPVAAYSLLLVSMAVLASGDAAEPANASAESRTTAGVYPATSTTASHSRPATADRPSARSPATVSTPGYRPGLVLPRLNSVTVSPRPTAASVMARPRNRVPPSMSMRTGSYCQRHCSQSTD